MSQPGRHTQYVNKKKNKNKNKPNNNNNNTLQETSGYPPPIPHTFSRASNEKRTVWSSSSEPEAAPQEQAVKGKKDKEFTEWMEA